MAVKRKGNPKFALGVDSLGRPSWRVAPGACGAGLRGVSPADEEEVPVSTLPRQLSEQERIRAANRLGDEEDRVRREASSGVLGGPFDSALFATSGAAFTAAMFTILGPVAAVPVALLVGGPLAVSTVRRAAALRRVRRQARERFPVAARREYEREARRMVERFPHWYEGERGDVETKVGKDGIVFTHEATCRVDPVGVGEVEWRSSTGSGREESGRYFLYPGANLNRLNGLVPLHVQGVNLRGANMEEADLQEGGVFDGADLRDVKAALARLPVSLRYANCRSGNFEYADLSGSDVTGADFTGAELTGAKLPLDLTGVKLTREQFESLRGAEPGNETVPYRVAEAASEELLARFGGDRDALTVALWSGGVEVRDRELNRVVVGEYDTEKHYVPRWALDDTVTV